MATVQNDDGGDDWPRRVALGVLDQAVLDLRTGPPHMREAMRAWMRSADCAFWCAVAGLDHLAFLDGVMRFGRHRVPRGHLRADVHRTLAASRRQAR